MQRFEFRFDYPLAAPLAALGIVPRTSHVDVGDGELRVRFGPWALRTPIDNVVETDITGPSRWPIAGSPSAATRTEGSASGSPRPFRRSCRAGCADIGR